MQLTSSFSYIFGFVEKGEGSDLIYMMSSIESGDKSFCFTQLSSRIDRDDCGEELINILK